MYPRLFALLLVCPAMLGLSHADSDHYEARRLMESGSILPLEHVLTTIQKQRRGRILEVELEQEHDRYVYEIELLDDTGRVWKMHIDAVTGQLMQSARED